MLAAINTATLTGLRDRALIGTLIYTFARIGAAVEGQVLTPFYLLTVR